MRHLPIPVIVGITVVAVVSLSVPAGWASSPLHSALAQVTQSPASAPLLAPVRIAPAYVAPANVASLGPLPATTPLEVVVGLASRDPSGLSALVDAQGIPGTRAYRAFLPAPEAAERFGASPAEVRTASNYFEGYGLSVSTSPDGLLLNVEGASGSVARAFGTTFEEYRSAAGRTYVSHPTPASLPPVAPWSGALGLGNVTPIVPAAAPAPQPEVVPTSACASASYLTPCDVQTAYSLNPLLANGTNGTGERIAVVDAYSGLETEDQLNDDLNSFAHASGFAVGTVSYYYPIPTTVDLNSSGTNDGWSLEDALDVEWTRAMAPGAAIEMTYSPNAGPGLYAAIDWLVGGGRADVISLSWGEPDVGIYNAFSTPCPSACNASTDGTYAILGPVLQLAAVEGISVFAASGDCGASDGTSGLSTNFPASDPFVTGVGGTVLTINPNATYHGETGWSGNDPGSSSPGCLNQGGSGGGYAPFSNPPWQSGPGFSNSNRGVPDVSADAGAAVVIYQGGSSLGVEGTSVATPIWAGITADADQYAGAALGFLNPSLYRILNSSNYLTDFHDILSGNNYYAAGTGWDPVTGIGSPIVSSLVKDLARTSGSGVTNLSTTVNATPAFGRAPLTVHFDLNVTGGSGVYPLEGVYFGDLNATLVTNGSAQYVYSTAGVYEVQSFVYDSNGNEAVSPPTVVVVGGGGSLSVQLKASTTTPAVGAAVNFSTTVEGGTAPYTYDFFFGDGYSIAGDSSPNASHAYPAASVYCAEVVVYDSAAPPDGAASPQAMVAVGGATAPVCQNGTSAPVTIAANESEGVRDAPADFPALFVTHGGSPGSGLPTTTTLWSSDPYTKACGCTIFRTAGTYEVEEWVNDTGGELANASVNVTVAPPLVVAFSTSTDAGLAPLTVHFSAHITSGGDAASASETEWSFGNGLGGAGSAMNETYSTPGEYLAIGSLSDHGRGNASEAFLIDVEPSSGAVPLGVTATITPAVNLSSGTTVALAATLVGPASVTSTATLFWNLGDGHSAYGFSTNETYFGPLPTPDDDRLNASVLVADAYLNPLLNLSFGLPHFFATEPGNFLPAADALSLRTTVGPTLGIVPFPVDVSGVTSGPSGAVLEWLFGDRTTSNSSITSHTYTTPGGYTLQAVSSDAFEDHATFDSAIVANGPLGRVAGPNAESGVVPVTITFTASAYGGSGPPYTYNWTLPNGSSVVGSTLTLTLSSAGTFTVSLNVTDSVGGHLVRSWNLSAAPMSFLSVTEIVVAAAGVGILAGVLGSGAWRTRRRPTP